MDYRFLGTSGLKVSELALGAMTFGVYTDEETSRLMLDAYVDAGGNFIDTADTYQAGESETILGRWLAKQDRDQLVIATKVRYRVGNGPNDVGLSRKHILASVEASLRRLQTDHIDLYQVHGWDGATRLEDILSTLDDLVRAGKVRCLGASNHAGWQLQRAIDLQERYGWAAFVSLQPLYNLLDREAEWELLPLSRRAGIGVIPWSPLRAGWLTGKYTRDMAGPPEGTRVSIAGREGWSETWAAYANDHTWSVLDEIGLIAKETGKTYAQVALNWLLRQDGITAPIIGARTLAHFDENIGGTGWTLSAEQVARLTAVSDRPLPYPYNVITRDVERSWPDGSGRLIVCQSSPT